MTLGFNKIIRYVKQVTLFVSVGIFLVVLAPYPVLLQQNIKPVPKPAPNIPRVLHFEQTVAIVRFGDLDQRIEQCQLILAESFDKFDKIQLLAKLAIKFKVEQVDFATMMRVTQQCKLIGDANIVLDEPETSQNEGRSSNQMSTIFNGILPGTFWCGYDDVAPNYFTLGPRKRLDSCCRQHDHCPVKVKAFQYRYGMINLHPYTKVHCQCDDDFYNCLKDVSNEQGDAVGKFFFNFLNVQCLEEVPQRNCTRKKRTLQLFSRRKGRSERCVTEKGSGELTLQTSPRQRTF